jgi:hypothetical protein
MDDWKQTVRRIRQIKLELSASSPELEPALGPAPGASHWAVAAAERRLRRRLPPSYRAFLQEHDGWPLLFHGASLLGTGELWRPSFAELTPATFAAYEATLAEIGTGGRHAGRTGAMIPFGMDPMGTIVFAFNTAVTSGQGEMEVILWINGLGDRCSGFSDLLALVLDMLTNDLADREIALRQSA